MVGVDQPPVAWVSLGAIEVGLRLPAEQAGGVVSAVEVRVAPRRLALPHRHEREDELRLLVGGLVGWRVGDRELLAEPGSVTFLPRKLPHAYWNPGRSPVQLVLVSVPGDVERFFQVKRSIGPFPPARPASYLLCGRRRGGRFGTERWSGAEPGLAACPRTVLGVVEADTADCVALAARSGRTAGAAVVIPVRSCRRRGADGRIPNIGRDQGAAVS